MGDILKRTMLAIVGLAASLLPAAVAPAGAQAAPGAQYVALGDSYSAGPGSGIKPGELTEDLSVYEAGTVEKCNRSRTAYPALLAQARGLAVRNVSCGGAKVATVLETGQHGEPAQISAVTANARLVTLTLGGNDIGFADIVECVVTSECGPKSPAMTVAAERLPGLQAKLANVYSQIRKRAPQAKIVVAGYPRVIPLPGRPALGCAGWLSGAEQQSIAVLQQRLNDAASGAVRQSGGNITYLDPFAPSSPFSGTDSSGSGSAGSTFDACSLSANRMLNGIRLDFTDGSFHPNKLGHQAYFTMFNTVR